MRSTFVQVIIILVIASVVGLGRNLIPINQIDFVGAWRELSSGDGPVIPPTADEGDPPFIGIDVAQMEHSTGRTVFVDARDVSEFECGTIPGSISIPFDYLPEENLEQYLDSSLAGINKDQLLVIFCSGEECDLSLHLARNLQDFGYSNCMIFFGGSREWENFELELERREECAE